MNTNAVYTDWGGERMIFTLIGAAGTYDDVPRRRERLSRLQRDRKILRGMLLDGVSF
jgi:hypothetical protein